MCFQFRHGLLFFFLLITVHKFYFSSTKQHKTIHVAFSLIEKKILNSNFKLKYVYLTELNFGMHVVKRYMIMRTPEAKKYM